MNTTINLSLPKTLADLARTKVEAGYFSSISEVIRTALRQYFFSPQTPTYPMSPSTEATALKALEDYRQGKTKLLENPEGLGKL